MDDDADELLELSEEDEEVQGMQCIYQWEEHNAL